ncbi:hypothetical protein [Nafulsella turpanensis]|uniref:hypothetical protein n=1 Tax=Nafulsella turpanensis TaxID=1265690 RepID=UPI00034A6EC0|nr:hypothetical protein [Nafulsella turpanensis]
MNAYDIFLTLHSWIRWIILVLGIIAIIKAYAGWFGNKPYTKGDNGISGAFMGTLHLNLLIGLILYIFLSPIVEAAFNDFGAAMGNADLRFWAVEHILVNVIAVIVAQVGRSKAKKAIDDVRKHKLTAIFYTIAFILLLSRIPWGETERLFRW